MSTIKKKKQRGVFKEAKITTSEEGSMDLVLPPFTEADAEKLPNVSVVTITKDRGQFAALMLYNWVNIKYPREKLEWLILDDTAAGAEYDLRDYIPYDDPTIRYVKLDRWCPIAEKRNKAVEMAKYDIIVNMDDDDYYFPDHVLVKVRLMEHYKVDGVHSLPIGVYDLMQGTSFVLDPYKKNGCDTAAIAEATAAYKRSYWERNKYVSSHETGAAEGESLINGHFQRWVKVHFLFNMISITHSKNITGHGRRLMTGEVVPRQVGNFEDVFPEDFKTILTNIKKILKPDYKAL